MKNSIYFFGLIFSWKILQPLECSNLEARIFSISDSPNFNTRVSIFSYLIEDDNETVHSSLENESIVPKLLKDSTISTNESEEISKTCCKRESSTTVSSSKSISRSAEEKLENAEEYTENSADEGNVEEVTTVHEQSILNSILKFKNRFKREDEEEVPDSSSSNESSQDEATDFDESLLQNNNNEGTDEETEDSSNKKSNENWSSQLNPGETGSSDTEVREERNTRVLKEVLEESEDRNKLQYPYWYREPSVDKKYWSSYEREAPRNFIRIPIFPGK